MSRLIRKYANRRLYDTETSHYITLEDLKELIISGEEIQVLEAKSNTDLTREVLLQLIAEQEHLGVPILNESILTSLIRFYGHPMQGMASRYLELALEQLQNQRLQLTKQMQKMMRNPVDLLGDLAQQNLEWMNQLRKTFLESMSPGKKGQSKSRDPD
jgi:polyhydroxyalkanoate synthesis repressor PhaR